jgi:hypothetical protein
MIQPDLWEKYYERVDYSLKKRGEKPATPKANQNRKQFKVLKS